jgi:hypothetical protein
MTLESDAAAIGAVRASCDADLEHDRGLGSSQGRFQVSGARSPLNWLQEDALLAHALHCRRLAANPLIPRECGGRKVFGRKRRVGRSVGERRDWPDPELTHVRLHRTIYYSLDDAFVSKP